MSESRLGREVFRALAAVAWADGEIDAAEAAAIERAAREEGLTGEDLAAVTQATQKRVALKDVDLTNLSAHDKLYTYAIASWVAAVQQGVGLRERIALNDLGARLALGRRERDAMDAAVKEQLDARGATGGQFDLKALRDSLATRVAAAAAPT